MFINERLKILYLRLLKILCAEYVFLLDKMYRLGIQ